MGSSVIYSILFRGVMNILWPYPVQTTLFTISLLASMDKGGKQNTESQIRSVWDRSQTIV